MKKYLLSGLMLFSLVSLISGCAQVEHTEIHVLEGDLSTPWGKFKFQNLPDEASARQFAGILDNRTNYHEVLLADAGRKMMFVLDISNRGLLTVGVNRREWVDGKAIDKKEKTKIFVDKDKSQICHKNQCKPFVKKSLNQLKNRGYSSWNRQVKTDRSITSIYRAYAIYVEPLSKFDETFSINMPFEISDERFQMVLKVRKVKKSRLKFKMGVPATP